MARRPWLRAPAAVKRWADGVGWVAFRARGPLEVAARGQGLTALCVQVHAGPVPTSLTTDGVSPWSVRAASCDPRKPVRKSGFPALQPPSCTPRAAERCRQEGEAAPRTHHGLGGCPAPTASPCTAHLLGHPPESAGRLEPASAPPGTACLSWALRAEAGVPPKCKVTPGRNPTVRVAARSRARFNPGHSSQFLLQEAQLRRAEGGPAAARHRQHQEPHIAEAARGRTAILSESGGWGSAPSSRRISSPSVVVLVRRLRPQRVLR